MNYLHSILSLITLVFITTGCSENDCVALLAPLHSLEEQYGCSNTAREMQIDLQDDFTLIHSQEEFEFLVTGTCQPQIDFDSYTLLIGKKGLISGNDSIEYAQDYNCNTGHLTITVTFYQNLTDEAPNLTWHVLLHGNIQNEMLSVITSVVEP